MSVLEFLSNRGNLDKEPNVRESTDLVKIYGDPKADQANVPRWDERIKTLRKLRAQAKITGPGRPLFGMKVETPQIQKTSKKLRYLHDYGRSLAKMVTKNPD